MLKHHYPTLFMKCALSRSLTLLMLVVLPAFSSQVVINEIMYHPSSENPLEEYIELHNRGTNTVDLSGWRFVNGVDFTFPPGTTLGAGDYLVVAANLTNFQQKYSFPLVINVLGDWTGQLSNGGERIELADAQGNIVSEVRYADSGDWGVRVVGPFSSGTRGWEWAANHDGAGSSLELINSALPLNNGQNWAASPVPDGSPGAVNGSATNNIAPLIYDVGHSPAIPRSTNQITINARVVDELPTGFTATLFYRNATTTTPPPFTSAPMFDDGAHNDGETGDGIYGAVLAAQTSGTIIEYYVQTSDGVNSRTWPAPALDEFLQPVQTANAQLQVDNEIAAGNQPFIRLILTAAERQRLLFVNNQSDALFNATFIAVENGQPEIRHNTGLRLRGAGSRGAAVKNHRVNFPSDRPWRDLTAINLNSLYIHAQLIGGILAQKAGVPAANGRIGQVRINGVNLARADVPIRSNGSGFGSYLIVEPINGEWAGVHFPDDGDGNVYRASTGNHNADLSYRGTSPAAYTARGYAKNSNTSENDWTDLMGLTYALSPATPDHLYTATITQHLHLRQWLRYFALFALTEYTETSLGSGRGDDYALYRGLLDPRFYLVGHDFDTIFNEGDSAGNVNESIFVAANETILPVVTRFLKFPEIAPLYYEELHHLATNLFQPAQLEPLFDQHLASFVPEGTLNNMKVFASNRLNSVLAQIPDRLTAKTLPTVTLLQPVNGGNYFGPTNLPLQAAASDTLGINRVEFYANNQLIGFDTTSPYSLFWSNTPAGLHTLTAVAIDNIGLASTSAPVTIQITALATVPFITFNSVWRYHDQGANLGTAWRGALYDDSGWDSGPAQLGYGDGDEATVVSFGGDPNNKYITTYFRSTFLVTNLSEVLTLTLRLLRDDAGVVYLNGSEVFRSPNITSGTITYTTRASTSADDTIDTHTFGPGLLVEGINQIAVEIHQQSSSSSDISFDFDLTGVLNYVVNPTPLPAPIPSATNTITLGGQAPAIETRSVTIDGQPAGYIPWRAIWQGTATLEPGINRVLIQAWDGEGREVERTYVDVSHDSGSSTALGGSLAGDTTLPAAGGPYFINSTVTVPDGVTLTIQPGATLLFTDGASLVVAGGGRLLAEGTDTQRIRFTRAEGAAAWGRIDIQDSTNETRLSYVDIEYAGSSSVVRVRNSVLWMEHVHFTNITSQYVSVDDSSFNIRNCIFPSLSGAELIHGSGLPAGGYGIIESNWFGTTTGLNDIIDFTGGQRPGAILQILHNTFTAASDDHLDLDGTDAFIEGNLFMGARQGTPGGDTASAISGGSDSGNTSEITIVRNIFYNCDHAVLAKEGNFYTLVNNTLLHIKVAAVNFNEPLRNLAPGAGAALDGNIVWDCPTLFANFTNGSMTVTVNHSIIPTNFPGAGNLQLDPLLANTSTNLITPANLREAVRLLPGSPALASGPNGLDMGALVPSGASISGEPPSLTITNAATLVIGGPGITHYSYRFNTSAWSGEIPIATLVTLSGLADGTYLVEAVGKNDAGVWQGTNYPATSRSWTVQSSLVRVQLNEILARNVAAFGNGGGFPDAIEIHNAGSGIANLSGWGLSDEGTNKFKFTFPQNTTIAPGGYLLVFADDDLAAPGLHAGFGLDQRGDSVFLHNGGGALVDAVTFGPQLADFSIGREVISGEWTLGTPTFGAANASLALGDPRGLRINEWLADGGTSFGDDFIELYNPSPAPVNLGGFFLSDEPLGWPQRSPVPPLSFIAPNGFLPLFADGNGSIGDHVNFRLASERGAIGLADTLSNLVDCVFYGPQLAAVSQGRQPSGGPVIVSFSPPTPGVGNPVPQVNCTITTTSLLLMPTNQTWRYNESGTNQGTVWRNTGFNDASWPSGQAFLGFEPSSPYPYLEPVRTPLSIGSSKITFYFRTHFTVASNLSGFNVIFSAFVDDGAIFYLNGAEVGNRIRMTSGTVTSTTLASSTPNEPAFDTFTIPGSLLLVGDNVMAVEVHQNAGNSSDVLFGLALHASRTTTNCSSGGLVLNEVMANNLSVTNAGSTNATDWVELYNAGNTNINLAGMSLSDDIGNPVRWVFPAGASLAPGAYLVVGMDGGAPASTNSGGTLNSGFGLKASGDEIYLIDSPARGGAVVDSIAFGIQAPDLTIGRVPNPSGGWALNLPTPGSANLASGLGNHFNLRINEWLANPSGNDDDFFEIYNPNAQPVALGGLFLTDDLLNKTKYQIPSLSFVGAGENAFALFIADNNTDKGADHVNFGLTSDGESIGLFAAGEVIIDSLNFTNQENGVSEGRFPNGAASITRFRGTKTPGRSNLLPLESVVINEVLTHTDAPLEDAIELFNPTTSAVDLSGWFLSDNKDDPKRYRIPNGTVLGPGGFVVVYESQFNPLFDGRRPFFALNSSGDDLFLHTADANGNLTGYRTGVSFGAAENGFSFGRYQSSVDVEFTALSARTFGADNPMTVGEFRTGRGATNAYPRVGPVVVSEVMYHPPDLGTNENTRDEFIELHNITGADVALFDLNHPTNTWRLRDALDFNFPTNVTLPAGGFLLVVDFDPVTNVTALTEFRAVYNLSPSVPIYGPWSGRLANNSENIELYKPDAPDLDGNVPFVEVDKVKYADTAPWPVLADGYTNGAGASLQRRVMSDYGNDPVNWIAGVPTPGASSGAGLVAAPVIDSLTPSHGAVRGSMDTFIVVASGAAPLTYQWRFNGAIIPGATNTSLTVTNLQLANAGFYSVLVVNPAGAASATLFLEVQVPPGITTQPQNASVAPGVNAQFNVSATGTPPLRYQWRRNGSEILGATGPGLTITNAQLGDDADFSVVITNFYGSITSSVATLTVTASPLITSQPVSTNIFVGESVTFSIGVSGAAPLSYQWRFNGNNIANATNSSYTIVSAVTNNSGGYSAFVVNRFGAVLSTNASLVVSTRPTVTLTASDSSASEPGANTGRFTLTRTGSSTAQPLLVNFTVGGSATPGADYFAFSSPATIPAGSATGTLTVSPIDDNTVELPETVSLMLVAAPAYSIGASSSATVTITDNDNFLPTVTLTNPISGALFAAPGNVPLGAEASDVLGVVVRVSFYINGTNKVAEATNSPYLSTWTNAQAGVYSVAAVAIDDFGARATSAPVVITLNGRPAVTLTSPTNGSPFIAPATVSLDAVASDPDGSVSTVEFYQGATLIATGVGNGTNFSTIWSNVAAGVYSLSARAIDNLGTVTISTQVNITVYSPSANFSDDFATRGVLTGFTNFVTGSSAAYTREAGEPKHADRNGSRSGWLTWTATFTGPCTLDTEGSSFDTTLAVYTNNPPSLRTVTNLVAVSFNDDASGAVTWSRLTFTAQSGRTYQIAVDGYAANEGGSIILHMSSTNPNPRIVTHPQSQIVDQGTTVTFTGLAAGPQPLFYQWRSNGVAIAGKITPSLVLSNVGPSHQALYSLYVFNNSGAITSAPASLIVRSSPTITSQPQSVVLNTGEDATFSTAATGTPTLAYQWRFNGSPIVGATNSSYTRSNVQFTNAGSYSVSVINLVGSATSLPAELMVRPRILSMQLSTNGIFQMNFAGVPNQSYTVERAVNATNWSAAATMSSATGLNQFSEAGAITNVSRLYRLRQTP
jgi:Lamin Tail Domain/CotH kinase protein/Bacterial Ig domain/Immunoglobulin domain/Immunoglobulin I-set domain